MTLQCAPPPSDFSTSPHLSKLNQMEAFHIKLSLPFMSHIENGAFREGEKKHVILCPLNAVQMQYSSSVSHQATTHLIEII